MKDHFENTNHVPVTSVVPINQMAGDDDEDTRLLAVMAQGAQNYIQCFPWVKTVREIYFGDGYGGIVAVFLFRIEPKSIGVDEWLWVIFGDVPPAYIVTDRCKVPSQALEAYIDEMSEWVRAARNGQSTAGIIPVYVPATPENAVEVENRLKVLRQFVVPAFREAETVRG